MATSTDPETAAEAGFPVTVAVDYPDGELSFYDPADGSRSTYTVEHGKTTASTRARLQQLVAAGGQPLIDTPSEGAPAASTGGTTS